MQMRDDLGITTKLENGKAYLEFALPEKIGRLLSALQIEIWEEAEGGGRGGSQRSEARARSELREF